MIVAVPRENHPGERRVALVPASVPALVKAGMEILVETGAGQSAGYPDQQYVDKGAKIAATRAEVFAADILLQVRAAGANPQAGRGRSGQLSQGPSGDRAVRSAGQPEGGGRSRRERRHAVLAGTAAAHHPGAEHGRAFVAGHDRRLSGGADGGRSLAENLPHAHHRRRNAQRREGFCDRGGRGGIAGHRHRSSPGRGRVGLRRSTGGEGAGAERRRQVRRGGHRRRRRGDQGRLRPGNGRGVLPQAAGTDDESRRRARRRHHHRGHSRQEIAHSGHRRNGRQDGAGLGDRRSGGRARRQLRVDQGRTSAWSNTA